jgi:hypothetical protein
MEDAALRGVVDLCEACTACKVGRNPLYVINSAVAEGSAGPRNSPTFR